MKQFTLNIALFFMTIFVGYAQESLSDLLEKYNTQAVPYMSVQELAMPKTNALILDSREQNEYNVSHLEGAVYVGYNDFQLDNVENFISNKDELIVVYCSLGIRSEDIAEQLKKAGYSNVYNLYGGIFEWKNADYSVYNAEGETNSVHGFSKEWSKWLIKGDCVYE
jgi:rhodanese-related sulfurtransferase